MNMVRPLVHRLMEPLLKGIFVVTLNTICSCVHPSISISEQVAVSLCSGESGSDSSSEGSEENSHNVSLAELLLHFCCVFVMYTQ